MPKYIVTLVKNGRAEEIEAHGSTVTDAIKHVLNTYGTKGCFYTTSYEVMSDGSRRNISGGEVRIKGINC